MKSVGILVVLAVIVPAGALAYDAVTAASPIGQSPPRSANRTHDDKVAAAMNPMSEGTSSSPAASAAATPGTNSTSEQGSQADENPSSRRSIKPPWQTPQPNTGIVDRTFASVAAMPLVFGAGSDLPPSYHPKDRYQWDH